MLPYFWTIGLVARLSEGKASYLLLLLWRLDVAVMWFSDLLWRLLGSGGATWAFGVLTVLVLVDACLQVVVEMGVGIRC